MTADPQPTVRWRGRSLEFLAAAGAGLGMAAVHLAPLRDAVARWGGGWTGAFLGNDPTKPVLGDGVDLWGNLWNMDYTARLLTGEVGRIDPDIFAPVGQDLARTTGLALLDAVLAFPLVAGLGAVGGYNLYLLLLLVANTIALHLLFRVLRAPPPLALALAVAVMLHPFVAIEILQGRPNQVHLLFPALFLALLYRMTRDGARTRWLGPAAGLALAASCLIYPFSAMALGLFAGVVAVVHLLLNPGRRLQFAGGFALLTAVACAAVTVTLIPVLDAVLETSQQSWEAARTTQPFSRHQIDSAAGLLTSLREAGLLPYILALGFLPTLAWPARRRVLPWAIPAWIAVTLPLGAVVAFGTVRLPTAFALSQWLVPPMTRCHNPERLLPVPLLGLLCAVAIAAGWALGRLTGRTRRLAVAGAVVAVLTAALLSRPDTPASASRPLERATFYERAVQARPGGIIDVPLWASNHEFHYQLLHRQPLLGGPGIAGPSTRPEGHADYVQDNSMLRGLEYLALEADAPLPGFSRAAHRALWDDGFRLVVVHLDRTETDPERFVEMLGARHPIRRGPRVAITIPDPTGRGTSRFAPYSRLPAPELPPDRVEFSIELYDQPPTYTEEPPRADGRR